MEKATIEKLEELNKRFQSKGFSWQHEDYFFLKEALPEIIKKIKGELWDD